MSVFANNAILDLGLRGALFGASVGGVIGLSKGFLGERRKQSMNGALQRQLQKYEFLSFDGELFTHVVDLGKYRKFDRDAYAKAAAGCNRLVCVQAQLARGQLEPKPSVPRLISLASSQAVEGIRTLRAAFQAACPGNPSETESFDEIAGAIQKTCNNYQHNVSMEIQVALASK